MRADAKTSGWARAVLGSELAGLVDALGSPLAAARIVTRLPSPAHTHASFQLVLADGRVLKGRRVETRAKAQAIERWRPLLDPRHFPPVLARRGRALLETWVPGRPFSARRAPLPVCRRAGALLATLHGTSLPASASAVRPHPVADRLAQLRDRAAELAARGAISASAVPALVDHARRHAPDAFAAGLIHRDFCAENMVVGRDGRLWVIDNESLAVDALDFDLARTWYRWPMDRRQRHAFAAGYRRRRSMASFLRCQPFWTLAVLVETTHFRLVTRAPRAVVPLRRLRRLLRALGSARS